MALVAYGSSDESESEEEETIQKVPAPASKVVETVAPKPRAYDDDDEIFEDEEESIIRELRNKNNNRRASEEDAGNTSDTQTDSDTFQLKLPPPKYRNVNFNNLTLKAQTLKVLPSLGQVKSSDEPPKKRPAPSPQTRNGLLQMLPTPKNEFTIMLTQVSKESKAPLLPYALMKPKTIPKPAANTPKDEDDNDVGSDFFSLTKTYPEDEHVEPIDIDKLNAEFNKPTTSKPVKQTVSAQSNMAAVANTLQNYTNYQVPESSNVAAEQNSVRFDDSAMKAFFGRKHRGPVPGDVEMIDINEDEVLAESRQMLTKQLTEEVAHTPTFRKGVGPTSMQKRKHQITYLAYQAREREMELKNQWAQNRLTKRQTQSKYGF